MGAAVLLFPSFFLFFGVFSTRYRGKMGNGNVLRVVGRDARGRESNGPARAARFVREHATELGVGAALLGGAILAGTLHQNWAVPTEPANEFEVHMPQPVQAPVARLPVPPPKDAEKVWRSDEAWPLPGLVDTPQSPRSEADPSLPAAALKAEQAQPKEEWELDEVHAKLETPLGHASSEPPKSAGVRSAKSGLDMVNAARASAETKRAAKKKQGQEKLDEERKELDKRAAERAEVERRRQQAERRAFNIEWKNKESALISLTGYQTAEETFKITPEKLREAYNFFKVTLRDDPNPTEKEIEEIRKAFREKMVETHPDRGSDERYRETIEHMKVIKKGRMKAFTLPYEKSLFFGRSRLFV